MEAGGHTAYLSDIPTYTTEKLCYLYRDTVVAWREALRMAGKLHICTRHTPIRGNPQGADTEVYSQWEEKGLSPFHQLFHPRTRQPKTFNKLSGEYDILTTQVFFSAQITHHWKSWFSQPVKVFDRTRLNIFLEGGTYKISSIYSRLQNSDIMKGKNTFKSN